MRLVTALRPVSRLQEFDGDSPVYVGCIRGDRSVVKAELRDETVRNGVVELYL